MSAHTPGPWFTKREGWSTVYIEARIRPGVLQEVAACGPTEAGQEQQEANARLISAAPELLEALKKRHEVDAAYVKLAMSEFDDNEAYEKCLQSIEEAEEVAQDMARAAIAKAGGAA